MHRPAGIRAGRFVARRIMMTRMRRIFLTLLCLGCLTSPVFAWSNKEHIQLTRIAVERLLSNPETPERMKDWLKQACPDRLTPEDERDYFLKKRVGLVPRGVDGIPYWATVLDMMALMGGSGESEKKIEPFGV